LKNASNKQRVFNFGPFYIFARVFGIKSITIYVCADYLRAKTEFYHDSIYDLSRDCLRACNAQDNSNVYMALEFVNGGELFTYMRRSGKLR